MQSQISPRIHRIMFASVAMLVLGLATTPAQNNSTSRSNNDSPAAAHMRTLNNSLLTLHGQMQAAGLTDARLLHARAANVIAQRAAALSALIQSNPHTALTFAFSPELLSDLVAKFPESASQLESHATVTGPVQHWIADYPGFKSATSIWQMKTGGRPRNLHFGTQEPANLKNNQQLQATGVLVGSEMAVETSALVQSNAIADASMNQPDRTRASQRGQLGVVLGLFVFGFAFVLPGVGKVTRISGKRANVFLKHVGVYAVLLALLSSSMPSVAQNSCSTMGVQNTAVLLVNLPGGSLPAGVTQAAMQDVFFATNSPGVSLDGFLREASFGRSSATGSVFGPYNLTGTYTSCSDVGGALLNDAIDAAVSSGVNLNSYGRVFLIFPDIFGCGWAGFASNSCTITSSSGTFNASLAFVAASYALPRSQGVQVASHEIGHNLGLFHSGTIAASSSVLGPVTSPGVVTDMGDYWSTMGSPELGLYPAPQRAEILGWMTAGTSFQTVQNSGTYTLQPLESGSTGLQAIKVQRGTGNNEWLWVEYRQPSGNYDSTLFPQPFSGALIHYEDSNTTLGHTYLPNFTPADTTGNSPALAVGQTWTDPYSNLSLAVLGANSSGLTVNVSFGAVPCTPASPTVVTSPLDPSIYPGSTASYSLTILNNDSSACAANTFALSSSQPSNWTTTFSTNSVTLSPGQSASVTMNKTGPSGTAPGTYAVNANATNNSFAGSGTANVTVMAAPALAVSVSLPASIYTLRSTVPIAATVMNGGVPASGASVTFSLTAPNGSISTQSATTSSNGVATWNFRTGSRTVAGTYAVSAYAALSSGSKRAASAQGASSNVVDFTLQ